MRALYNIRRMFFPLFGQNWVGADPKSSSGNPTTEQYEGVCSIDTRSTHPDDLSITFFVWGIQKAIFKQR